MIIDEADYVEHFGVKGMHWGVRKEQTSKGASSKKQKTPLTREQKQRRIDIGLAVLSGGIFVGTILAKNHQTKMRDVRVQNNLRDIGRRQNLANQIVKNSPKLGVRSKSSSEWLRQNKLLKTPVSQVRPSPAATRKAAQMRPETKKWIADFTAKQNKLIREANDTLRTRDNDLQIPFAARSYLEEWT